MLTQREFFSMLKKIQTDMRSDLNNDTICCLICAKQNQNKACFEFNPSDSVLRAAKKAVLTYQSSRNLSVLSDMTSKIWADFAKD